MLRSVIFDMDGVLVDNSAVHLRAFAIFCRRYGVELQDGALDTLFGKGNDEILPALLPRETIARYGLEALGDEKEAVYREIYAPEIVPQPGLTALLDRLTEAGITLAVGSSGPKANVDFVLDRCGIADRFAVRIDGDQVTQRKPDPDIFLTALRKLGTRADECLVFEDSPAGLEAARRAGIATIALTTTLPRPQIAALGIARAIVDDFTTVDLPLLRRIVDER